MTKPFKVLVRFLIAPLIMNFLKDKIRYDIFIKKNDCKYIRLWKSFIDVPVAVEYDVEVEYIA